MSSRKSSSRKDRKSKDKDKGKEKERSKTVMKNKKDKEEEAKRKKAIEAKKVEQAALKAQDAEEEEEKKRKLEERKRRLEAWKQQQEKELAEGPQVGQKRKFKTEDVEDELLEELNQPKAKQQRPPPGEFKAPAPPAPAPDAPAQTNGDKPEEDPLDAFMAEVAGEVKKEYKQAIKAAKKIEKEELKKREQSRYFGDETGAVPEEGISFKDEYVSFLDKKRKGKAAQVVDHSQIKYNSFRKDFYIEVPEITNMSNNEVKALRKKLENIRIRGKDCPRPILRFSQAGLSARVIEVLNKHGYKEPTPIQAQAIPAIMSGRDLIGVAKTGSGKTLAFVLPMLRHVLDQKRVEEGEGPIALCIAPTRELALQINREIKKFTKALPITSVAVYGGAQVSDQIGYLKGGAEIVVCTPGRMIDILCLNNGRVTNLRRVTYLVLDEADRMFDMGFEPQIMRIIDNIRPNRQSVLFSATFPRSMEILAKKVLTTPVEIVVGNRQTVSNTVDQFVRVVEEDGKLFELLRIMGEWYEKGSILVFVDKQETADNLFRDLVRKGYPCSSLHGGKDQMDRHATILDFKDGTIPVMVATSVAARGLDVKGLNLVINYDIPGHLEDYIHRVGRTGRAGNIGTAYTFITPEQDRFAADMVKVLTASKQDIPEELKNLADGFAEKKKAGLAKGGGYKSGFVKVKGFKFDAEEEAVRDADRARQKKSAGMNKEEEEHESPLEKEMRLTREAKAKKKSGAAATKMDRVRAVVEALQNSKDSGLYGTGILSSGVKRSFAHDGSDRTYFSAELEINDYPEKARWKVTHKGEVMFSIMEETGCAVTTRGIFVPEGRKPKNGDRKLYLYIEGSDEYGVLRCKAELRRMVEEASEGVDPTKLGAYGKYNVLAIGN